MVALLGKAELAEPVASWAAVVAVVVVLRTTNQALPQEAVVGGVEDMVQ